MIKFSKSQTTDLLEWTGNAIFFAAPCTPLSTLHEKSPFSSSSFPTYVRSSESIGKSFIITTSKKEAVWCKLKNPSKKSKKDIFFAFNFHSSSLERNEKRSNVYRGGEMWVRAAFFRHISFSLNEIRNQLTPSLLPRVPRIPRVPQVHDDVCADRVIQSL